MNDNFYVYMLSNRWNTLLHIGVTDDLSRRIDQPLTSEKLVHVERYSHIRLAVGRQKTIRAWRWEKKVELVHSTNRDWSDLSERFAVRKSA